MVIKLIPAGSRGGKFTFPSLPESIQVKYGAKYQSFDILSQGTVKVPKGTEVSEFTWNGVFFGESKKEEPIVKKKHWKSPRACVNILNEFMMSGKVLNLIVTKTWINEDVTISSFQPKAVGAYGNIEYSITFVQKKQLKVYTTNELKVASFVKKTRERTDTAVQTSGSTYEVRYGDTLYKIAQSELGSSEKWVSIYDLNADVIEQTAKAHGFSSSDHGHWIFPGEILTLPSA